MRQVYTSPVYTTVNTLYSYGTPATIWCVKLFYLNDEAAQVFMIGTWMTRIQGLYSNNIPTPSAR